MSEADYSIYPDFFRIGIGKMQGQNLSGNDLPGFFSALQQFQRDIKEQEEIQGILRVAQLYLSGLGLFQCTAFYLINPASFDFELAFCAPETDRPEVERLVLGEIKAGKFAWALRQSRATFFTAQNDSDPVRAMFHPLSISTHTIGMFCGLLHRERLPSQEIAFSLLSILLGTCAHALGVARNTAELKNKILLANQELQRALQDNEILARIPAESPSPVIRLQRSGRILYCNAPGQALFRKLGWNVGDWVAGAWLQALTSAFESNQRGGFEVALDERHFSFVVAAIPEAGYANFYGTDITERVKVEQSRQRVIEELQDAIQKVRTLSGMLPICASCKKIRDDRGYWNHVEKYIQHHTDAKFSHGICPDCMKKLYPEYADEYAKSKQEPNGAKQNSSSASPL